MVSLSPTGEALSLKPQRLGSIDAYRGFVMFLMMAEVLRLSQVAAKLPDNSLWKLLAFHQSHVPWAGCSLHDLIQPSFSFLVGVSLPFSGISRDSATQKLHKPHYTFFANACHNTTCDDEL